MCAVDPAVFCLQLIVVSAQAQLTFAWLVEESRATKHV